jgi:cysteine desulfurase family protein (TIGR01976 family)
MNLKKINIRDAREHFPALQRKIRGETRIFFDGPAGTQVPRRVISAISSYYRFYNSNTHGQFQTALETDRIIQEARNNMAALLGAEGPHTISFGPNMTSLNFALSHAIRHQLQPGDEVLITQLDHEANRGPWLELRDQGVIVREVRLLQDGRLDYNDFESKITESTRLVAMGWASNALGTVNDVRLARQLSHRVGAWLLIDAVHYAPHFPIDVQAVGADFLLCSSYKFYGPHMGILYSKPGLLDRLQVSNLRTQQQSAPYRIETGTLNHAAIAGLNAALAFIASLGDGKTTREKLHGAMRIINEHEKSLLRKLYNEISGIEEVSIIGPTLEDADRAPTLALTHPTHSPLSICKMLGDHRISAWDGHFYAIRAMEVLGLMERGGVTRIGLALYSSEEDIEKLGEALRKL